MPDTTPNPADDQPLDPWLADRLVSGSAPEASAALNDLIAAAQAPAVEVELAGEAALRAAFAEHGPLGTRSGGSLADPEGNPMRSTRRTTKLAAAVAVATLSLVGVGAAAVNGSLPGVSHGTPQSQAPVDDPGDDPSDVPGDEPSEDPGDEPTDEAPEGPADEATDAPSGDGSTGPRGPDATGPAAYGLCNAFTKGGLSDHSTAYANLAEAAGGEENIEAYCATIEHPGNADHPTKDPNPGKAGDHPTKDANPGKAGDHPTKDPNPGKAGDHPTKDANPGKGKQQG